MRYAKYLGSERYSVNITFFVLDFIYSLFFFFLKNLKTSKIITFRRMNLPSFSGKEGETPILLDPVDRAITCLWIDLWSADRK
jgi:hypothetical protein